MSDKKSPSNTPKTNDSRPVERRNAVNESVDAYKNRDSHTHLANSKKNEQTPSKSARDATGSTGPKGDA